MISGTLLYYISEWAVRLVMLFVVPRRRHPSSAMAWLLLIFLVPWVGLAAYLLVGRNSLPRRLILRHGEILAELRSMSGPLRDHPGIVHPSVGGHIGQVVTLARKLGDMAILGGNAVEMMTDSAAVIDRLVADIDAAEHHVHLLFFIFAPDETGRRVIDALVRAAQRGVTCRVLADSVGSRHMLRKPARHMRENGVDVQEVLPVGLFRRHAARIDLRNHRKLAVIDGRIGHTGSQNIVDPDYGTKGLVWHDLMVRLTGPIVIELQGLFIADWYFTTGVVLDWQELSPGPETTGTVAAQLLPSGPNYPIENYQRLVVTAIHTAQKRVTITTPYFVPDDPFLQAVQTAVLQDVDVNLILPKKTDHPIVDAASRAYYDDLLEAGAKLYLFQPGLLHAKTMSIDGAVAFIGSSNFDIRSFALNFEINLLLYDEGVARQLEEQQQRYMDKSVRVVPEEWARSSPARRVVRNVAKLFSPLL